MPTWVTTGGPPLPYLFILEVDVLSRILKLVFEGSFVQKVGPWNLGITCLQDIDDTIMLLPPNLVSIRRVKILIYLSGLSINFLKSSFYQLGPSMWICPTSLICFIVI